MIRMRANTRGLPIKSRMPMNALNKMSIVEIMLFTDLVCCRKNPDLEEFVFFLKFFEIVRF